MYRVPWLLLKINQSIYNFTQTIVIFASCQFLFLPVCVNVGYKRNTTSNLWTFIEKILFYQQDDVIYFYPSVYKRNIFAITEYPKEMKLRPEHLGQAYILYVHIFHFVFLVSASDTHTKCINTFTLYKQSYSTAVGLKSKARHSRGQIGESTMKLLIDIVGFRLPRSFKSGAVSWLLQKFKM